MLSGILGDANLDAAGLDMHSFATKLTGLLQNFCVFTVAEGQMQTDRYAAAQLLFDLVIC